MDCFQEKLSAEGISGESAFLITNARRTGTNTHYEWAWRKWSSWCSQRQINSAKVSLPELLNFLTDCFHERYEYNTIASYKSAISEYHESIDRYTVGEHHRDSAPLSGIFNNRLATQPKFNFVRDVKNVLDFLETMNSEGLRLKEP